MPQPRPRLLVPGLALCAAVLAFAAKLMLVHAYGSDVPYWDEWDAVGRHLLLARSLGGLHAANFLEPHNEHRIVFSYLLAYVLAVSNGQWDGLLEMSVNAAIHAALCAVLLLVARRMATGLRFAAVALVTLSLFVLPFDWENTLQGLQSQFYFLEWGAVGMILLCVGSEPLGRRWWAGWLVGAASLGTMASGFMAAAAALLPLGLGAGPERRRVRRDAIAAALLVALCLMGLLAVGHPPREDAVRAHSAGQWLAASAAALSWPKTGWPLGFALLQLPTAALLARSLRSRRVGGDEAVLIALALWSWLQVAAIAYGRATEGLGSSRYSDLFAVGSFANALALAILWKPGARAWGLAGAAWVVLFSCGIWDLTRQAQEGYLAEAAGRKEMERQNVRSFLATGDLARLESAGRGELPYPSGRLLGGLLAAPGIRAMLPMEVRPALPLVPAPGSIGFKLSAPASDPLTRVWTASRGPARFVSMPLPASILPFLHIAVSGSTDLNAALLRLETADGGEALPPFELQGGRWHLADLAAADGKAVRLAVDIPPGDHWFSFTEPVELGRGSWADHWLLRRSGALAGASGALFAAALLGLLASDLRGAGTRASGRQNWW